MHDKHAMKKHVRKLIKTYLCYNKKYILPKFGIDFLKHPVQHGQYSRKEKKRKRRKGRFLCVLDQTCSCYFALIRIFRAD